MDDSRAPVHIAVTTCYKPSETHQARARVLSERFAAPFVERRAFDALFAATGATHLYVVGREHEEVRARDGACFVQEGLLATKLHEGSLHPFVRALGPCTSLVDCTLGLANDALHAAVTLRCSVLGVEGSLVIHALLEEGLPRLWASHAPGQQIDLVHGDAVDVLRGLKDQSRDVVFLDPMMGRPGKSAPSFAVLRAFAIPERASAELLREAGRVARARVVLKLGKGAPVPADAPLAFTHHEQGAHVTYWVHTRL
ncbi:MAG: class I SAM-dependent methyltransferase [Deltaproteobacteria bacterium]|nr:class I SAM-dependent methyltransferase [Deltaproteobacteria bacterium]